MNIIEKTSHALGVAEMLRDRGYEVLRIGTDVFSKPVIEVATLPICEELISTPTVERFADGHTKQSNVAIVGDCRVEWRP